MNKDQFEGKWEQLKGQVKEKWGKLTNDDMAVIHGKQDQLIGKLREHYGYTAAQADVEFGAFMKECDCTSDDQSRTKHQPRV